MVCNKLLFFVNGKRVEDEAVDPSTTLAYYLRTKLRLTGTKIGCNEGGCGACTVMVSEIDISSNEIRHYSVNACLTPVLSVHGRAVTTVEGVGSLVSGTIHPVQQRLCGAHGSQCGFCTPGFVMAMYALLRQTPQPTELQIDEALQGNLCRCTGYRPILEAFYTFAKGVPEGNCCMNGVENGGCCKTNVQNGDCCKSGSTEDRTQLSDYSVCKEYDPSQEIVFPAELMVENPAMRETFVMDCNGSKWYQPVNLDELLALKHDYPLAKVVFGNTEVGIEQKFKHTGYNVIINPKSIIDLKTVSLDKTGLYIGAGLTLNEMNDQLKSAIEIIDDKRKCQTFVEVSRMLFWFAGRHVRNMASFAGNVATASPISDLNPLWLAMGAELHLASAKRGRRSVNFDEHFFIAYRKTQIADEEIVLGITIPYSSGDVHFLSFKQAQRREDDIAIVNAGMWVEFEPEADGGGDHRRVREIRLAFGGMAPVTRMATCTMRALKGKEWTEATLETALDLLLLDLPLSPGVPGGMERFRQTLALSFFFKFFYHVQSKITADAAPFHTFQPEAHSSLKATQTFRDVPKDQQTPIGLPIQHLSGEKHTTGEALYCDDVPVANVLHMALVLSKVANADIESVDYSAALQMSDVVGYVDHNDIPGDKMFGALVEDAPVFAIDKILFCGQPVAGILATTSEIAWEAAAKVVVHYTNQQAPLVTIEDAIAADSRHPFSPLRMVTDIRLSEDVFDWTQYDCVLEGTARVGGQEHFYLEPQSCLAIPGEEGEVELISSTQSVTSVQTHVAAALGYGRHKVVVRVRRIGGGFGGKESAADAVAVPTAVAAHKMQRPVKCVLERWDDMAMSGTRHPYMCDYKVGVESDGRIRALRQTFYSNCGYSLDLSKGVMERSLTHCDNVYKIEHLDATGELCKTNIQSGTAFRGFGGPQAMFCTESVIEHIADTLSVDSKLIREKNFYKENDTTHFRTTLTKCNARRCFEECVQLADYDNRLKEINEFNKGSRWVKRGVCVVPTKFGISFGFKCLNQAGALVHVYTDGTVLVSHAGMEMGQGLHTKVAQVAAATLQLPLSAIHVQDTCTDKVPNSSPTAASVGSDMNGVAVKDACEKLLSRLAPVRKENPKANWPELVQTAYTMQISLSATGFATRDLRPLDFVNGVGGEDYFRYFVYGAACSEVEVDCLTGDHRLLRTDIVMDVGDSLNPAVDIGQIEGAFIQGYGLFTMEELKCSPQGVWYTRGPGTYKIPSADDCPRQFHVKLLKNSSNPEAIFSSKAIGEPPLFLGSSAFFAIRNAVRCARVDAGHSEILHMASPATPERIRMLCNDSITEKVPLLPSADTFQAWTVEL